MCFAKLGEHMLESACQQQVDVRNNDCQTQKLASEICRRELHEYIIRSGFVCYLSRYTFYQRPLENCVHHYSAALCYVSTVKGCRLH